MKVTRTTLSIAALLTVLLVAACGNTPSSGSSSASDSGESTTLSLVGFAVPEAANKAIAEAWAETEDGKNVRWVTSYGASGDQSRSVASGLEADYVHFSVESDVTRLVEAGLIDEDWNTGPTNGTVSSSVVVFAVREGNPKNITSWEDLIQSGVEIVTPNPSSSGAARWNALAAYGQAIDAGATDAEAEGYLTALFKNVVALPGSGRDATTQFLAGTGDVLLAYENEAIFATQNGQELDWVLPDTTLLIENPGAVLTNASEAATKWLDFVLSADGQYEFAQKGFRPVIDGVDVGTVEGAIDPANPFPEPKRLLTVADDFVSWADLTEKFFNEETGIVTRVLQSTGNADS